MTMAETTDLLEKSCTPGQGEIDCIARTFGARANRARRGLASDTRTPNRERDLAEIHHR